LKANIFLYIDYIRAIPSVYIFIVVYLCTMQDACKEKKKEKKEEKKRKKNCALKVLV